jgi:hypothetical protein
MSDQPYDRVKAVMNGLSKELWHGIMDAQIKVTALDLIKDVMDLLRNMEAELKHNAGGRQAIADLTAKGLTVMPNPFEEGNLKKLQQAQARAFAIFILELQLLSGDSLDRSPTQRE